MPVTFMALEGEKVKLSQCEMVPMTENYEAGGSVVQVSIVSDMPFFTSLSLPGIK